MDFEDSPCPKNVHRCHILVCHDQVSTCKNIVSTEISILMSQHILRGVMSDESKESDIA